MFILFTAVRNVLYLDINEIGTNSCVSMVALNSLILLTAMCQCTAVQMECIVAFPWQQWLCEHAKILCYTYIACLVLK
jgi:hypothetical protein